MATSSRPLSFRPMWGSDVGLHIQMLSQADRHQRCVVIRCPGPPPPEPPPIPVTPGNGGFGELVCMLFRWLRHGVQTTLVPALIFGGGRFNWPPAPWPAEAALETRQDRPKASAVSV